ncbi:hypothetical protein MNEG_2732 [Monoraphidium neglectum]|uniref:Uncharacterized protein n=1 Tax=Monoraphidium neglectum TaxID=145388 RepID=A0A0D2MRK9_9CHLO|nr:hypothetical protein MNEG_2732 [Monoraphidium neglectum]KIZ05230.1 hypothetical protein MNEG_2732 [Monoraphidium neglectum]|eukprot:XP_013904249.1 hypothetical protein MNEG_2732 [Monoraphidium neglectum]
MAVNVVVDNSIRAVPLVGGWVAPKVTGGNTRNLKLLRRHMEQYKGLAPAAVAPPPSYRAPPQVEHQLQKAWGLWGLTRHPLRAVFWLVRRLPLVGLLACVVLAPMAAGLGLAGLVVYTSLKWIGVV